MPLLLLYFSNIIEFICGVIFGMLGHFFSIICFPFLAFLKAGINILAFKDNKDLAFVRKHSLINSLAGAVSFYLGLIVGILLLIFVLIPNSQTLQNGPLGRSLATSQGIIGGIGGGLFCGVVYIAIYILVAFGVVSIYLHQKEIVK